LSKSEKFTIKKVAITKLIEFSVTKSLIEMLLKWSKFSNTIVEKAQFKKN
jgi:hypothetical protein